MSVNEIVLSGTIGPDGTLQLDGNPGLLPGRVEVVLRQETSDTSREGWWPYLQRVREERETSGYHFMSDTEMTAHIQWLRDDEDRIDRIHRELDLDQRSQEKP